MSSHFKPQPKFEYFRSEAHLRAVRTLTCCNCGTDQEIQAAHSNQGKWGKGTRKKASHESCVSLCPSCHAEHDQTWCKEIADQNHENWLWRTATMLRKHKKLSETAERLLIERGVLKP